MGSTERRERHRQNVRTQILDVARDLFAAEGYEAVTMRRIAQAVEYSPTAIYLHFKDKDALINELCRVDLASLAQAFEASVEIPDPLERLREIGRAYVDFGRTHPNPYRLLFMSGRLNQPEQLADLGHGNPQRDGYALLLGTIEEAMAQQRLATELTDADLIAQSFWACTHGAVALHLANHGDPWVDWRSLEDTSRLVIDAFLRGISR